MSKKHCHFKQADEVVYTKLFIDPFFREIIIVHKI